MCSVINARRLNDRHGVHVLGEAINELGGPTPGRFESAHASVGHTNLRGPWDKQAASRSARPAVVLHSAQIVPRQRGGGAKTIPLVSRQVGANDFLNCITIFEAGAAIPEHIHNCDESVLVIKGSAIARISGEEYSVGVGDNSFIPAGIPHYFHNVSATKELHIFWTYASIDAIRTC